MAANCDLKKKESPLHIHNLDHFPPMDSVAEQFLQLLHPLRFDLQKHRNVNRWNMYKNSDG